VTGSVATNVPAPKVSVVGTPLRAGVVQVAMFGVGPPMEPTNPFCGIATLRKLFVTAITPAGEDVSNAAICAGNVIPDAKTLALMPTDGAKPGATPIVTVKVPAAGTAKVGKVMVFPEGIPTQVAGAPVGATVPACVVIVGINAIGAVWVPEVQAALTAPGVAGLFVITAADGWTVTVRLATAVAAVAVQFRTMDPVNSAIP